MALQRIQPDGLHSPGTYSQVVVARGGRTVYVAGQVSVDEHGDLVAPGDLAGQARQAYANVVTALGAVGAGPANVARIVTYVVGYEPGALRAIRAAREELFEGAAPASTLIGVAALAAPEYLIEVEAVAVVE